MKTTNRKRLFDDGGPVFGPGWTPILITRDGAMAWGRRKAKAMSPKGFWTPSVFEGEDFFRVSFGGQPERGVGFDERKRKEILAALEDVVEEPVGAMIG